MSKIKDNPRGRVAVGSVDMLAQQKFEDLEYLQQAKSKIGELTRTI